MKQTRASLAAIATLLLASCSAATGPATATLSCRHAGPAGSYVGLYSFHQGELPVPPPDPDLVDIAYYFDGDDCRQGAIIGRDDRPGYLFPVGHEPWRELLRLESPSNDARSVATIAPLTRDKEGFAFWVKTGTGEHVLVRLSLVEPASHRDLVSGATPRVGFEWSRPTLP